MREIKMVQVVNGKRIKIKTQLHYIKLILVNAKVTNKDSL